MLQYRKLTAGERHRLIFAEHLRVPRLSLNLPKAITASSCDARPAVRWPDDAAPHECGPAITRVKRFWNVVVSANLQANDTSTSSPFAVTIMIGIGLLWLQDVGKSTSHLHQVTSNPVP